MNWRQNRKTRHAETPPPVQEFGQLCTTGVDFSPNHHHQFKPTLHVNYGQVDAEKEQRFLEMLPQYSLAHYSITAEKAGNTYDNDIKEFMYHHLHNGFLAIGTLGLVSLAENDENIEISDDAVTSEECSSDNNNLLNSDSAQLEKKIVLENQKNILTNPVANREINKVVVQQFSQAEIESTLITPSNASLVENLEIKTDLIACKDPKVEESAFPFHLSLYLCEAPSPVNGGDNSLLHDQRMLTKNKQASVTLDENDEIESAGIKVFPANVNFKRVLLSVTPDYLAKHLFKSFKRAPQQMGRVSNYQSKLQKFLRMLRRQKRSNRSTKIIPRELPPPLIHCADQSDNCSLTDDTSLQCAKGNVEYWISTDDEFVVLEL